MAGKKEAVLEAKSKDAARQRSAIAFPYMSLNSAVELATAIHQNVGNGECDDDQLAAWSDQSPKSSGFRVQVYAARTFNVLEAVEGGKHKLSEIGRAIVDPNQERAARVRAFLAVPLYKAIYDNYKGGVVPPAAALERDIVALGVSEKQKDRARQVFERSAEEAGFFEHGRNRLVAPGIVPSGKTPEEKNGGGKGGGSGNGGGAGELDPVIAALIQKLPTAGKEWSADERVAWLHMMSMAFQMSYGHTEEIEIKIKPDN